MSKDYHLRMGPAEQEYFALPKKWSPLPFSDIRSDSPKPSVGQMTRDALSRPAKTAPLKDLVADAKKIAIIIDDCTRPTPVSGILEVLLPYLEDNGHNRADITIVVALGTHAPVPAEDLKVRVGSDVVAGYRIVQHNSRQVDLTPVLLPDNGMVVGINPEVAGADAKIGISSILPHPMAGYGGGPKIVMPGVSDFEFIRAHHMKQTIAPGSYAGNTTGNPFHEGCLKVARAVGLDFSINCVYNRQGEIVRILGGGLDAAFGAAVDVCLEELGIRFEEKVDITIASTYPHTHAHQFIKGLNAADVVTREDGAILLAVPTLTRLPGDFLNSFNLVRERSHNKPVVYMKEAMSRGMPFLPEKPLEFNMAMKCAVIRPGIRTILVSPMISETEARTMGFEYAPSVSAGVDMLEASYPEARVAIFPSGGLIVPITAWER